MYNNDDILWEDLGWEATEDDYQDDIDGYYDEYDYLGGAY